MNSEKTPHTPKNYILYRGKKDGYILGISNSKKTPLQFLENIAAHSQGHRVFLIGGADPYGNPIENDTPPSKYRGGRLIIIKKQ